MTLSRFGFAELPGICASLAKVIWEFSEPVFFVDCTSVQKRYIKTPQTLAQEGFL